MADVSTASNPDRWFYKHDVSKHGPIDAATLCGLVESGKIDPTAPVWREGMPEWQPACDVEGLLPSHVAANARRPVSTPRRRWSKQQLLWMGLSVLTVLTAWVWFPRSRLPYHRVSGEVTYADGTPIPIDGLVLRFHSFVRARGAQTLPAVGQAVVDRASGRFASATTFFPGDGILAGTHKVTLHAPDDKPLPEGVASSDYEDVSKTSLRINTQDTPLKILIDKP